MPYIKKSTREVLDPEVNDLISLLRSGLFDAGEINYVFSRIVNSAFDAHPSYSEICKIDGVLAGVAREFYRRKAAPYEDKKIQENGDL